MRIIIKKNVCDLCETEIDRRILKMRIITKKNVCDLCGTEIDNCNNEIYSLPYRYVVCNKCYKENVKILESNRRRNGQV